MPDLPDLPDPPDLPDLPAAAPTLRAGAAKSDITPEVPVYLGGYGIGPFRRSKSIGSRLFARALALEYDETTIVIIAIDTHGLLAAYKGGPWGHFDIEEAVKASHPEVDGVFSVSTHTHSGPDSTGVWGGLPESERLRIVDGSVTAAREALDRLGETQLSIGISDATDLLKNQCDFEPHLEVDGRVSVIEAGDIGRLVVTSGHPTVGSTSSINADWYGVVASTLDEDRGGVSLVLPGAIGRTQPATRGDGSAGAVRSFAAQMLEPVRRACDALEPVLLDSASGRPSRGLSIQKALVESPMTNPLLYAVSKIIGRRDPWPDPPRRNGALRAEPTRAEVTALHLGPVLLAGFPGEAYPNLGWELQTRTAAETVIPVSLVGDQIGYLIYPSSSYSRVLRDAYKNDNSYFCASPAVGERLLERLASIASR